MHCTHTYEFGMMIERPPWNSLTIVGWGPARRLVPCAKCTKCGHSVEQDYVKLLDAKSR